MRDEPIRMHWRCGTNGLSRHFPSFARQRKVKPMILPIARVLLLSTILGGFAVSASFAQGTQGGQGQGGQTEGMQGGGGAGGGAGGGQVVPPPGTPPSGASKQSDKKQHDMQDQQGQSGGQAMDHKKHRGEGEQAGRRDGGRGEMDMRRGRHEGRHRRDARFRYYHGGFWYADPWWTVVVGNDRHVRWCRRHYPNYRAGSNTYITPHGRRRVCVSPFG